MDFNELMSVASNKQKVKEKELSKTKVGFNTHFNSPANSKQTSAKKKVDDEKQKKIDKIRARVEAQSKKSTPPAPVVKRFNDEINDFTGTGLSENDIRRKKRQASTIDIAKKRQEFLEKVKHLKENPIRPEEEEEEDISPRKETEKKGDKSHESKDHKHDRSKDRKIEVNGKERSKDRDRHDKYKDVQNGREKHKDHRHKDRSSSSKQTDVVSVPVKKPPPPVKKKKTAPGPPPMSFTALLSMAEKNKNDPKAAMEVAEKKVEPKKVKEEKPARPMTQDEKDRIERTKSAEYQRWLKHGGQRPANCPTPKRRGHLAKPTSKEIVEDSSEEEEEEAKPPAPKVTPSNGTLKPKRRRGKSKFVVHSKEEREEALQKAGYGKHAVSVGGQTEQIRPKQTEKVTTNERNDTKNKSASLSRPLSQKTTQSKSGSSQMSNSKPGSSSKVSCTSKSSSINNKKPSSSSTRPSHYDETRENILVCEKSSKSTSKKMVAPSRERTKPPPPTNPWDRIYGEIQKNHPKPDKKRKANVIESDEEYDSEMDDFIADDDDDDFIDDSGAGDYSKYISEIFRYDKRKYRDVDEDLSDMEVGFAQQMKEEIRSGKIGLQEDLEDIRQEEEEMRRKKLAKKGKKMRMH